MRERILGIISDLLSPRYWGVREIIEEVKREEEEGKLTQKLCQEHLDDLFVVFSLDFLKDTISQRDSDNGRANGNRSDINLVGNHIHPDHMLMDPGFYINALSLEEHWTLANLLGHLEPSGVNPIFVRTYLENGIKYNVFCQDSEGKIHLSDTGEEIGLPKVYAGIKTDNIHGDGEIDWDW